MLIRFFAGFLAETGGQEPDRVKKSACPARFRATLFFWMHEKMRDAIDCPKPNPKGHLMTFKTSFVVLALTLTPGFAMAYCQGEQHAQTISCSDGKVFDSATKACVPVTG
jgi:hypothetical protein